MFICTIKAKTLRLASFLALLCLTAATVTAMAVSRTPESAKTKKLPIIMYHSVLKDKNRSGKYIVTPEEVESDFKYLKENGYTSVLSSDLISYTAGGDLGEKIVMITFDDGYLNNVTNVLPLLEKYDLKAVISVVGSYTELYSENQDHNPNYSYFNYDDIKTLLDSGRVEIANHSYDLHKIDERVGCSIIKGEDKAEYKKMLKADLLKTQALLKNKVGYTPAVFTYPYGSCCESAKEVVEELGFKVSLGCAEKLNYISRDQKSLYDLGRFNRESNVSTKKFMARLEK